MDARRPVLQPWIRSAKVRRRGGGEKRRYENWKTTTTDHEIMKTQNICVYCIKIKMIPLLRANIFPPETVCSRLMLLPAFEDKRYEREFCRITFSVFVYILCIGSF